MQQRQGLPSFHSGWHRLVWRLLCMGAADRFELGGTVARDPREEREYQTRRERIDPQIIAAGWTIVEFDASRPVAAYSRHALTEYPTDNGPADYAFVVDGRLLGIVEAKKAGAWAARNSVLAVSPRRRASAFSASFPPDRVPPHRAEAHVSAGVAFLLGRRAEARSAGVTRRGPATVSQAVRAKPRQEPKVSRTAVGS